MASRGCLFALWWCLAIGHALSAITIGRKPSLNLLGLVSVNSTSAPAVKKAAQLAVDQIQSDARFKFTVNITWIHEGSRAKSRDFLNFVSAITDHPTQYHGILGPQSNNICEDVSRISYKWSLMSLSYACTSEPLSLYTSITGSATDPDYPYFARTANRHRTHPDAWSDLLAHFKWKRIMVLSEDSREYNQARVELLKSAAAKGIVNIHDSTAAIASSSLLSKALDTAKKESFRVIVANMGPVALAKMLCVMKEMKMHEWDWVVIGAMSDLHTMKNLAGSNAGSTWGQICTLQDMHEMAYHGMWTGEPIVSRGTGRTISGMTPAQVLSLAKIGAAWNWQAANAYDSVWAWALAAKKGLELKPSLLRNFTYKNSSGMKVLHKAMQDVDFAGITGRISFYNWKNMTTSGSVLDRTSNLVIRRWSSPHTDATSFETALWSGSKNLTWRPVLVRWSRENASRVYNPLGPLNMESLKRQGLVPDPDRHPCNPGYRRDTATMLCKACDVGTYSRGYDAKICMACVGGEVNPAKGQSRCKACLPGTIGVEKRECVACKVGKFQGSSNKTQCLPCKEGSYASSQGLTACAQCPASLTTMDEKAQLLQGSESRTRCLCRRGQFLQCLSGVDRNISSCAIGLPVPTGVFCARCPGGFHCQGAYKTAPSGILIHAQPAISAKNYIKASAPHEAFACKSAGDQCIGGGLEKCGGGRSGVQCSKCGKSAWAKLGQPCSDCAEGGNMARLPLAFLGLVCIVVLHQVFEVKCLEANVFGALTKIAVMYLQLYAALASFNLKCPEPLAGLLDSLSPVLFDLKPLASACYYGDSLAGMYIPRAFSPFLIFALYVAFWCVFKVCASYYLAMNRYTLFNTLGSALSTVSLGVVLSVLNIFECSENPSAEKTLSHYEGHLCNFDVLAPMLPIAVILGMSYILCGLVVSFTAVYLAPKYYHQDERFRACFQFLFSCWHPECWYWGALTIVRNVLIGFICVATQNALLQCLLALFVFGTYLLASIVRKPWRDNISNWMDSTIGLSFLVVLLCCMVFAHKATNALELSSDAFKAKASLMTIVGLVYPRNDEIGAAFDRLAAATHPSHPGLTILSIVGLSGGTFGICYIMFVLVGVLAGFRKSKSLDESLAPDLVQVAMAAVSDGQDDKALMAYLTHLPEKDLKTVTWGIDAMSQCMLGVGIRSAKMSGIKLKPSSTICISTMDEVHSCDSTMDEVIANQPKDQMEETEV